MLIFEYTRRYSIDQTSLINEQPSIWRWTNPELVIVPWMFDLFNVEYPTSLSNRYRFSDARIEAIFITTVTSLVECIATEDSFFWDNTNQVAYFNFADRNPHTFTSIDLARVYGGTDEEAIEFDGILYPTILMNRPTVTRSVEPVVYQRVATQSTTIELRNDQIWRIASSGKPEKYWRFDDVTDLVGQTTFLKYGKPNTAYEDLIVIQKGVIVDYSIESTKIILSCDDKRTKLNKNWPSLTYEDAGYTADDVSDDLLTKVIPDGYGDVLEISAICVDRETHELLFDEETDVLLNPPTNKVPYTLNTWNLFDVEVIKSNNKLGGFDLYALQKTAASTVARLSTSYTATSTTHRMSGYLRLGTHETSQRIQLYKNGFISLLDINFQARTYTTYANTNNVRVKFIEDNNNLNVYFSIEYTAHTIGESYSAVLFIDNSTTDDTIGFASGIKVTDAEYVPYRVAKQLTSVSKVYKEQDDKLIELTAVDTDLPNGIIYLHECDAHVDGLMDNNLIEMYVNCRLRDLDNPMDIIVDINRLSTGIQYVDNAYNKAIIEAEKVKLDSVSLYKNEATEVYAIIEELQGGSTVGFRYDDVDKIYMTVDDPNKDVSYWINNGAIINRAELVNKGNTTLYADTVTVTYKGSNRVSEDYIYTNSDYSESVLYKYNYPNPRDFYSLLTTEAQARNKSIILLEDLSVARSIVDVKLNGLDLLSSIDLYDIIIAELRISDERAFMGITRCQVIGLLIDTEFDFVTITLRQRAYSTAFADITGSYGTMFVLGEAEAVIGDVDSETAIGGLST